MKAFALSDEQAKAILDMRLQRLTGLEQEKIVSEAAELEKTIARLRQILSSNQEILNIIKEELNKARETGDAARYAAYQKSAQLMRDLIRSPHFVEFLTIPAYRQILSEGN
jgi:DNA gyrase subunit A